MEANISTAWLDDCARLSRAFSDVRNALNSSGRTKAGIQPLIDNFAEIVESRFANQRVRTTHDAESAPQFTEEAQIAAAQESDIVEQIQAMCALSRCGVETLGWWNAMQQRFESLESRYSNLFSANNVI